MTRPRHLGLIPAKLRVVSSDNASPLKGVTVQVDVHSSCGFLFFGGESNLVDSFVVGPTDGENLIIPNNSYFTPCVFSSYTVGYRVSAPGYGLYVNSDYLPSVTKLKKILSVERVLGYRMLKLEAGNTLRMHQLFTECKRDAEREWWPQQAYYCGNVTFQITVSPGTVLVRAIGPEEERDYAERFLRKLE
jgi:hypothetical protein